MPGQKQVTTQKAKLSIASRTQPDHSNCPIALTDQLGDVFATRFFSLLSVIKKIINNAVASTAAPFFGSGTVYVLLLV